MRLRASIAASRFAARSRNGRGPRDPWHALALRWRQRRGGRPSMAIGRAPVAVSNLWLPQFHLHFGPEPREWRHPKAPRGRTPMARVYEATRIVLNQYWTTRRAAAPVVQSRGRQRTGRGGGASPFPVRTIHALVPVRARAAWSPRVASRAPSTAPSVRARLFQRTVNIVRHVASDERASSFKSRKRVRQPWLQMLRPRILAQSIAAPNPSLEGASSNMIPRRSPDLAWRTASRLGAMSTAGEGPRTSVQTSSLREPAQAIDAQATPGAAARRPERAPALQISDLAPALVDRLTDDVIRRVERRVRIERERRGR